MFPLTNECVVTVYQLDPGIFRLKSYTEGCGPGQVSWDRPTGFSLSLELVLHFLILCSPDRGKIN